MNDDFKVLRSVGCLIDKNGVIYPQNADGSPDCENATDWELCSREFYKNLSKEDKLTIESVMTCKAFRSVFDRFIF